MQKVIPTSLVIRVKQMKLIRHHFKHPKLIKDSESVIPSTEEDPEQHVSSTLSAGRKPLTATASSAASSHPVPGGVLHLSSSPSPHPGHLEIVQIHPPLPPLNWQRPGIKMSLQSKESLHLNYSPEDRNKNCNKLKH